MFRLAGHLKKTVAELYETMDAREFNQWLEFSEMEPFGCEIDDIRTAMVSIAADNNRGRSSRIPDYLPPWSEHRTPRVQTPEQIAQICTAFFGGNK